MNRLTTVTSEAVAAKRSAPNSTYMTKATVSDDSLTAGSNAATARPPPISHGRGGDREGSPSNRGEQGGDRIGRPDHGETEGDYGKVVTKRDTPDVLAMTTASVITTPTHDAWNNQNTCILKNNYETNTSGTRPV